MRKIRKPEDRTVWKKRFEEFLSSGKSQAAWCKEKDINPNTFNFWYLRLKAEKPQPKKQIKAQVKWLALDTNEIKPKTDIALTSRHAIDIKIANVTIEVTPEFIPDHLLNPLPD